VTEILSVPFAAAALVLCAAGTAKLHSPTGAVRAVRALGAHASPGLIRALGVLEFALGVWCLVAPGPRSAAAAAGMYAAFAAVARALSSRQVSCGCFGDSDRPASAAQCLLSALLAAVCVAGAVWTPRALEWMLARPTGLAGTLVLAVVGCAYAIVMAYTLLPSALSAWSPGR
jgi:hypothetical protein